MKKNIDNDDDVDENKQNQAKWTENSKVDERRNDEMTQKERRKMTSISIKLICSTTFHSVDSIHFGFSIKCFQNRYFSAACFYRNIFFIFSLTLFSTYFGFILFAATLLLPLLSFLFCYFRLWIVCEISGCVWSIFIWIHVVEVNNRIIMATCSLYSCSTFSSFCFCFLSLWLVFLSFSFCAGFYFISFQFCDFCFCYETHSRLSHKIWYVFMQTHEPQKSGNK